MIAFATSLGAKKNSNPMLRPIFCFGIGALLGWPFSAAMGIPYVLEEFLFKTIASQEKNHTFQKQLFLFIRTAILLFLLISVLFDLIVDSYSDF